jgi:hypothetical protein
MKTAATLLQPHPSFDHRNSAKLAKKRRSSVVMRPEKMILTMCSMMLLAGVLAAQNTTPPADQQTPNQQPNATQQPNGAQPYGTQQPNATEQQNREQANNNVGEQGQTLIDPGVIYNARKPGEWIGKRVTLKNVMVQDTNDTGNFWVGSDRHHRLLIVKPTSNLELHALRVHKGDVVTVTGDLQAASEVLADKTGAEKNSLHDAEKTSGVFLMANRVNISSSTSH